MVSPETSGGYQMSDNHLADLLRSYEEAHRERLDEFLVRTYNK